MKGKTTIVINGQRYDAQTGLPVDASKARVPGMKLDGIPTKRKVISDVGVAPHQRSQATKAKKLHSGPAKSTTLRRSHLKKPVSAVAPVRESRPIAKVIKSPMVQRFRQTTVSSSPLLPKVDSKPSPLAVHIQKKVTKTPVKKPKQLTGTELKEKLIAEKLAAVKTRQPKDYIEPKKPWLERLSPRPLVRSLVIMLAIFILGGYFMYLNMPGISVRIAAAQAGIGATFPSYQPNGYRFDGPVAYEPGQVRITFASNSLNTRYVIKQQVSSWNSEAVLENIVLKSGKEHRTNADSGLTIFTYGNSAAWVNGGVLYTITGNAVLSNDQLVRIASSL